METYTLAEIKKMNVKNPEKLDYTKNWGVATDMEVYGTILKNVEGAELVPMFTTYTDNSVIWVDRCFIVLQYKGNIYRIYKPKYNQKKIALALMTDENRSNLSYKEKRKLDEFRDNNMPQFIGVATESKLDTWVQFLNQYAKIAREGRLNDIQRVENRFAEVLAMFGDNIHYIVNNPDMHVYQGYVSKNFVRFNFVYTLESISETTEIENSNLNNNLQNICNLMQIEK